jgi:LacI family transcriptional regulator
MAKRVSLQEVAQCAGVSVPTASRVLSGVERNVDIELANRVRAAASDLGYRVNAAARALRRQSTDTLALLVPGIANPYFAELVAAYSQHLATEDKNLVAIDTNEDVALEAAQLRNLDRGLVDAVLVVPVSSGRSGAAITELMRTRPVVQVDRTADGVEASSVGLDNAAGVELLIGHLRATGRRRIVMVDAQFGSSAGRERMASFRRLARPEDWVIDMPSFTLRSGIDAAHRLLEDVRGADAVICAADIIAIGMLTALQQAGKRVPEDIAITGFDGISLASAVEPGLTTLTSRVDDIVRESLRLIDSPTTKVALQPTLHIHGSTMRA